MNNLPIAIIGAGPVGLAAAAHLAVRGIPFLVYEAGSTVAANVLSWKHIRVFSPWRYNIDKAARQLLESTTWQSPADDDLPTGADLFESLRFCGHAILTDALIQESVVAVRIVLRRVDLDSLQRARELERAMHHPALDV